MTVRTEATNLLKASIAKILDVTDEREWENCVAVFLSNETEKARTLVYSRERLQ